MEKTIIGSSSSSRTVNRGVIEENTLAILDATDSKYTRDANDDSAFFFLNSFPCILHLCLFFEKPSEAKLFAACCILFLFIWFCRVFLKLSWFLWLCFFFLFWNVYCYCDWSAGIAYLEAVRAASILPENGTSPTK